MDTLRTSLALAAAAGLLAFSTTARADEPSTHRHSDTTDTTSTTTTTTQSDVTPSTTTPIYNTTTTTQATYDPMVSADTEREQIRPNRPLLITGGAIFAGSYLASVISAAQSDTKGDNNLYIPVVGPWIDMGNRDCGFGDCGSREDVNNALLLGSGVLQGAGAALLIASVFVPENRERVSVSAAKKPVAKPEVKVLPISLRAGAGIGAVGTF